MSTEICGLGQGHSLFPWECRLSVGTPFQPCGVKVLDMLKDHTFVPLTARSQNEGARIVKHVLFLLLTVLFQESLLFTFFYDTKLRRSVFQDKRKRTVSSI